MTIKKINISEVEGIDSSVFPAGTVYFNNNNELRRADGFTAGGILIRSTATDNLLVLGNTATYVEVTTSTTVVIHTTDPVAVTSRSAENVDMSGGDAMGTSIASSPTITDVKSGWVITGAGIVGITTVTNAVINGGWYIISLDDSNGSTFIGHNGTGTYQTYTFTTPKLYNWVFGTDGYLTLPSPFAPNTLGVDQDTGVTRLESTDGISLYTNGEWLFGTDGSLTVPGGGIIENPAPEALNLRTNSNNNGYIQLQNDDTEFGSSFVYLENGGIGFEANENRWTFSADGRTTFPVIGAPTTSKGASSDKAGMIAVNSASIFYCIADFTPLPNSVTVDVAGGDGGGSGLAAHFTTVPEAGWTLNYNGQSSLITTVNPQGDWYVVFWTDIFTIPTGAVITYGPSPLSNIWVKQAWGTTGSW